MEEYLTRFPENIFGPDVCFISKKTCDVMYNMTELLPTTAFNCKSTFYKGSV